MILRFRLLFSSFFCELLLLFTAPMFQTTKIMKQSYGLTETSFMERYGNHKRSFRHERYKNDTELSKYIWNLTSAHKVPTIKWRKHCQKNTRKHKIRFL